MQLFLHTAFAIASCITKPQYIHAQNNGQSESDSDEFHISKSIEHVSDKFAVPDGMRNHTFVALIDIVFTDGTKRTCTGTIIHNNVVITARHCFGKTQDKFVQPEITASFVVIGSKKMFESGYEQYLPIERIISHPKYRGWTADIALVYTFAGMMSDKPGTIMPLAGEKISIPNHSNITVFSWGHCRDSDIQYETENVLNDWKRYTKYPLRANEPLFGSEEVIPSKSNKIKKSKMSKPNTKASQKPKAEKSIREKSKKLTERHRKHSSKESRITKGVYRSQTPSDEYTDEDNLSQNHGSQINYKLVDDAQKNYGSIFKSWRRNMGSEKNELSVENFKFVNMQTCEEMMRKALPEKYKIKNTNEFICYTSEDRFVTDDDAGAPAIRHGHLVAVTVGGVECDDEHVAIGIKINCFCSWIAENLPDGGDDFKCCDHCCDDEKSSPPDEDEKDETEVRTLKKKKHRPKI